MLSLSFVFFISIDFLFPLRGTRSIHVELHEDRDLLQVGRHVLLPDCGNAGVVIQVDVSISASWN